MLGPLAHHLLLEALVPRSLLLVGYKFVSEWLRSSGTLIDLRIEFVLRKGKVLRYLFALHRLVGSFFSLLEVAVVFSFLRSLFLVLRDVSCLRLVPKFIVVLKGIDFVFFVVFLFLALKVGGELILELFRCLYFLQALIDVLCSQLLEPIDYVLNHSLLDNILVQQRIHLVEFPGGARPHLRLIVYVVLLDHLIPVGYVFYEGAPAEIMVVLLAALALDSQSLGRSVDFEVVAEKAVLLVIDWVVFDNAQKVIFLEVGQLNHVFGYRGEGALLVREEVLLSNRIPLLQLAQECVGAL